MPERPRRLDADEIAAQRHALPGWEVRGEKLTRAFKFKDFIEAVNFVNRVAPVAESKGHHPDLQVSWGLVVVELTTHDAGGLTDKDFELASLIDGVA